MSCLVTNDAVQHVVACVVGLDKRCDSIDFVLKANVVLRMVYRGKHSRGEAWKHMICN